MSIKSILKLVNVDEFITASAKLRWQRNVHVDVAN